MLELIFYENSINTDNIIARCNSNRVPQIGEITYIDSKYRVIEVETAYKRKKPGDLFVELHFTFRIVLKEC